MTSKTHRLATDFFAASYILASSASALDAAIIGVVAWRASTWPDDLEPDGTFGVREHHGFVKRHYIQIMRRLFPWLYRHRGWTHWFLTGALIAAVAGALLHRLSPLLAADVFRGILIGCWGHALEDAATISGAPLFGPFTKKSFHLMPPGFRFNTNGPSDTVLRWSIVIVVLVITVLVVKNVESPHPMNGQGLSGFLMHRD